jgi:TonB family protein
VQPNPPETVYTPGHDGVSYPRIRYSVGPDVRPSTPLPPGNGNGSCVLDLIVDANGVPQQVKVLRSLSPDLDPLAVKAASQWRFFPAELHGKPVAVRIQLQIQFHKR